MSTIENHEHFSNIGYSLKQALFRASDRTLLYRFFRAIRLDPLLDDVVPVEIRRALAIWSRRQGPSADRLHRLATDAAIEPLADSILVSMARNWDGRLRDPRTGSRSLPLRLMLTMPGVSLELVAPCDGESSSSLRVQDGAGQTISLVARSHYYEPAPLPISVDGTVLADGIELSGDELSFFLDADEAVAFRLDDDLAAWVSSSQIIYGERHHVLVHAEHRAATEAWLAAEGARARWLRWRRTSCRRVGSSSRGCVSTLAPQSSLPARFAICSARKRAEIGSVSSAAFDLRPLHGRT